MVIAMEYGISKYYGRSCLERQGGKMNPRIPGGILNGAPNVFIQMHSFHPAGLPLRLR